MAFKLPSIAMTGTKHPIHALCSSNASRGRANETHGQPLWVEFLSETFEQNEKWLDLKPYSTRLARRFDWQFNHRSNIKEVIWIFYTIYQIWQAGRMSWLVFTPHLGDDLNLISHFLSTLTPVSMTREGPDHFSLLQTRIRFKDYDARTQPSCQMQAATIKCSWI